MLKQCGRESVILLLRLAPVLVLPDRVLGDVSVHDLRPPPGLHRRILLSDEGVLYPNHLRVCRNNGGTLTDIEIYLQEGHRRP